MTHIQYATPTPDNWAAAQHDLAAGRISSLNIAPRARAAVPVLATATAHRAYTHASLTEHDIRCLSSLAAALPHPHPAAATSVYPELPILGPWLGLPALPPVDAYGEHRSAYISRATQRCTITWVLLPDTYEPVIMTICVIWRPRDRGQTPGASQHALRGALGAQS